MLLLRLLLTSIVLFVWGWLSFGWWSLSAVESGRVAGDQMLNSDAAYVSSTTAMQVLVGHPSVYLALLGVLAAIWYAPVKRLLGTLTLVAMVAAGCTTQPEPAGAFYNKTDYTEAVIIGPSESAFWVPNVGENVDSQRAFDSAAYLDKTKIASKEFIIPHYKLSNSGGFYGWDYYVPAGRLYIVDRAPYTREWVDAAERGTSRKKEDFPARAARASTSRSA